MMQNSSPRMIGRRALIKGAAVLAAAVTARAQSQPPPAEQAPALADVPLGSSVTVTVERRGDIVLVGLNRPFNQNRIDPPTHRSKPVVVVAHGDTWNLGHEIYLASDVRVADRIVPDP